ncbi:MAG: tRNA epoxyqueuosine(34) reductase QueG [Bosea sp. (in: a-proteobacteria)]
MVRETEVAPELPPDPDGQGAGHAPRRALRRSRFLTEADASPAGKLKAELGERARALGFDAFGITTPDAIPDAPARLASWLEAGHQGDMDWMDERKEQRANPATLWQEVRSVIMLGVSYAPSEDPMADLEQGDVATLSVYARRRDYHDVIKGRLKELAGFFAAKAGADVKVFVDTAPVMEKPLAAAAGLGWQGKHTVLVSRSQGSWLFLGAIFTTAELPTDEPAQDHCGSCRRCLDICPTNAFPAPYQLDARRCIAYLTIEHKGTIDAALRPGIGNRVFGCDDCLAVCPWNRFAKASQDTRLALRDDLRGLSLAELAKLDDATFRKLFAGTPIKRTGRDRFLRNVMIAIGNSGDTTLAKTARAALGDASPLVRAMAAWALARLDPEAAKKLAASAIAGEKDADVLSEWRAVLNGEGEMIA